MLRCQTQRGQTCCGGMLTAPTFVKPENHVNTRMVLGISKCLPISGVYRNSPSARNIITWCAVLLSTNSNTPLPNQRVASRLLSLQELLRIDANIGLTVSTRAVCLRVHGGITNYAQLTMAGSILAATQIWPNMLLLESMRWLMTSSSIPVATENKHKLQYVARPFSAAAR